MINAASRETANGPLPLADALALSKSLMDQSLCTTPAPFQPRTEYLAKAHGKFLRAQAVLICAQDEAGVKPAAAKAAAAVELLHLATLVHDDVIDNADTRRKQATLMKVFGSKQAVITGDYIFCLALRLAAEAVQDESKPDDDIPNIMEKICMGELLQSLNHRNFGLSGIGYLRIISGKTAALFEGSFYAGARLCGAESTDAKRYAAIGWHLGMIFQLADDCMDYEATVEQAQKPVLSDFEQGVVTLPLIVAIKQRPSVGQLAYSGRITKEEVRQAVKKEGGIAFTQRVSRIYYERAMLQLRNLNAPAFKKEQIASLLRQAMG
ncbi:MAG: polyprenyl synthetase family protein [Bacillota bacterium]